MTIPIDSFSPVGTRVALRTLHSMTVGSERPPLRLWGLAALIVAISISPRIQLPIQIPARAFDLRFEDIVLLVLVPAWLVWLVHSRRLPDNLKGVGSGFALYLAIALAGSVVGVVIGGVSLTRSAAYWAKEAEYLFILMISTTWIWGALERRFLGLLLIVLGVANAAWVGVQVLIGHTATLLRFPDAAGAYQRPHLLESYGPGLIGEVSPLSVGAFFMIVFLLAFSAFALAATSRAGLSWVALAMLFLIPNFLSQSRVTMAGCALGVAVLAFYTRKFRRIAVGFLAVVAVAFLASYVTGGISSRVTEWKNIEHSILFRVNLIWEPLLGQKQASPTVSIPASSTPATSTPAASTPAAPTPAAAIPAASAPTASTPGASTPAASTERDFRGRRFEVVVLGHGSGAMGSPGVIPSTEAHDQYLRVFLESGALGLGAFLLLLGLTVRRLHMVIRQIGRPPDQRRLMDKTIAIAALATLIAFIASAIVQDMFLPVLPNELLWFVVGMALSIVAVRQPRPASGGQVKING